MAKSVEKARAADPFSQGKEVDASGAGWNHQWTRIGQRVMGVLLEYKPFRNGHKVKIDDEISGEIKLFSAPTLLAAKLDLCKVGERLGIEYTGNKASKQASPMKEFRVVQLPPANHGPDDDLPF